MTEPDKPSTELARQRDSHGEQSLFRSEAIAEQQTAWLGTVLLAPSLPYKLFAGFAALTASAILALLFLADYTRKERVSGWLVPEKGLIQVFAPEASVIKEVFVDDGDSVAKGQALLVLSTELQSEMVGATQEEILRRLKKRRESLITERKRKETLHWHAMKSFSDRMLIVESENSHRKEELAIQRQRVELAEKNVERLRELWDRGLVAGERWQQVEDARLDQRARLQILEREQDQADEQWVTLRTERVSLPFAHRIELAKIDRDISTLEQEIAEAEARRRIVIPAPEAGTVTATQIKKGGSAQTAVPLLNIIPEGSVLQAELFVPSQARGFIKSGQRVLLRYQAFPFQKFGHYEGSVTRIARSAVLPDELARKLPSGLSLTRPDVPGPVYPVTVSLDRQAATAYGKPVALQPGMLLEADVQIERRRLVEWVLDPIYSLTGRGQPAPPAEQMSGDESGISPG